MSNKKTILVFIDWYLPGTRAGGPVRSVASMVEYLKNDFNFKIVTFDKDLHETQPYEGIRSNTWIKLSETVQVFYFSDDFFSKQSLTQIMLKEEYDLIYLNSFYSKRMSIDPLMIRKKSRINKPVVLAPRGMLGEGALSIKPLKKKIFMFMAKRMGIHRNITWQASSAHEKADIEKYAGKHSKIEIAGNLSWFKVADAHIKQKEQNELRLFFLSRVVRIKNVRMAIEILGELKSVYNICFDIYGPQEDAAYWKECEESISKLPENIKVKYKGILKREELHPALKNYHALWMPTANENFGHSILESLACGCPVIISDQTPWKNLQEKKAGADFPQDDKTAFIGVIEKYAAMDAQEFSVYTKSALSFAKTYLENDINISLHKNLFNTAK